jgi:charged multivesicular body protein 4A/B
MNLFGKAKAVKTTPKDAIVRLRESLDMLEKREKFLSTKIDAELKMAKLNATKNKRGRRTLVPARCPRHIRLRLA